MQVDLARLARSRGVSGPAWGPYATRYAGVSHLNHFRGRCVDVMFAAREQGGAVVLPTFLDVTRTNFHAISASPGLTRFAYKFDLIGLSDLVAVADFAPGGGDGDSAVTARMTLTNRTATDRRVDLEILAAEPTELRPPPELALGRSDSWRGAEDYQSVDCWFRRLDDGFRAHVKFDPNAVGGRALSGRWACQPGSRLVYRIESPTRRKVGWLGIRYEKPDPASLAYRLTWDGQSQPVEFAVTGGYGWLWVNLGPVLAGPHELILQTEQGSQSAAPANFYGVTPEFIAIDGFALVRQPREDAVVPAKAARATPKRASCTMAGSGRFVLNGGEEVGCYAIGLDGSVAGELTEPVLFDEPEARSQLAGARRLGCVRLVGLAVPAGGERAFDLRVAHGRDSHAALAALAGERGPAAAPQPDGSAAVPPRFRLGHQLLSAACQMNVSYPTFLANETIASYSPGKTFGGLYSWDAGMIGLGLLEVDERAAVECLNTYLCAPDEPADFIWHGTPLPTQVYLLNEIWQRTRRRDLLDYFYPRMRKWYRYLAGHTAGSPTDRFGTGLLNTYPLFYSTGGWDDLPPQVAVNVRRLEDQVTPVCTTAHAIRFARMMDRFAAALGAADDRAGYGADIQRGLSAIERTWDEQAGIYSYVHHATFEPLRHESGQNFNHTLDGVSPLVAGGCNSGRAAGLLARLRQPGRYWTAVGLSTVDQAAAYFTSDGYWNGCVWIPHQWFLWRAALDWGDVALARNIPRVAAEVLEREARRTHCTFEYVRIDTGLGGGYPHFSGLTSPALNMIAAISQPGRVTTGFDCETAQVQLDGRSLAFDVRVDGPSRRPLAMAVMPGPGSYVVDAGASRQVCQADDLGCLVFPIPATANWQHVSIHDVAAACVRRTPGRKSSR